jgi:hypothetical protein
MAFKIPYVYDFITKLFRQSSKIMAMKIFVILNKATLSTGNINGLNLAAVRLMIAPVSELPQYHINMISCTTPRLMKACE